MKVFVAGASGAIGKPLVAQLLEAGHEVAGMTRKQERADEITAAGGLGVVCDAFDREGLERAVRAAEPEVVVHALTALPERINTRKNFLAATSRLRSEGTDNLLAAARGAGARRMVAESVAFLYEPGGSGPNVEEDPMARSAPGFFAEAVDALGHLEATVCGADGIEGVVLRIGWLYGPGTHLGADGTQAEDVRRRRIPIVGDGDGVFSFTHVDDAASAFVAAVAGGDPGVYNVVDDEPGKQREWLPAYAEALDAKPPRHVPSWLAKLVAGRPAIENMEGMRGASNSKAKRELGWQPRHRSWRQGFPDSLA
jgi:nucleoside-diphosphate-sugar epimerase